MLLTHRSTLGGRGHRANQWEMRLAGLACGAAKGVWALGDAAAKRFNDDGQLAEQFELQHLGWGIGVDEQSESVWIGFDGEVGCFAPDGDRVGGFHDAPRLGRVTAVERLGDQIIVGDATARCLRLYDLDGTWIADLANANKTEGLLIPNGVVDFDVDRRDGTIVVANPAKHRLERYALDGRLLGFWGRFGMHDDESFGGCCNPTNIAVASDGRVIVAEKAPPRLKAYTDAGVLLAATDAGLFDAQAKNMSVATCGERRVYVADTARLAVLVFDLTPPDATLPAGAKSQPAEATP